VRVCRSGWTNRRDGDSVKIVDTLPYGRENAISSKQLAEMLGFATVRALQAAVERERRAGAVIISTTQDGGGYYLSNDIQEIAAFIRTLNSRAKHTRESTFSAIAALDKLSGQQRIDGI